MIVTPDANDDKTNEINQPIDDRTLCMTFSKGYFIFIFLKKGYSIFKNELEVFFTGYRFMSLFIYLRPQSCILFLLSKLFSSLGFEFT